MPMDCLALDADLAPLADRARHSIEIHRSLPTVEPGQLWLVEICPDRGLSTAERHVLDSANVILYDRSLGAEVAAILPLGGYAEPAPLSDATLVERCVRFAIDGWSVVRLIEAGESQPSRDRRLRRISTQFRAAGARDTLPIKIFADAGSRAYAEEKTRLGALDPAALGIRSERLIVVFGVVEPLAARSPCAVAANGLAG